MKLEQPAPNLKSVLESKAKKNFLDRLKKWGRIALLIGGSASALDVGYVVVKGEVEYNKYYATQEKNYRTQSGWLEQYLEKEDIKRMEHGNKVAFFRHKEKQMPPKISGFEELGFQNEYLEKLWSDNNGSYPRGWITGSVDKINFQNHIGKMSFSYGDFFKNEAPNARTLQGTRVIEFFKSKIFTQVNNKDEKETVLSWMDYTFGHELGHLNDPETSQILNLQLRPGLFDDILFHLQSSNPHRSLTTIIGSPDESNNINLANKKKETYLRAKEYWAEVVSDYFGAPDYLKERFPKDYEMVDAEVKRSDPNFDPIIAKSQRDKIIKEMILHPVK
jgi:hypothetical protein